MTSSGAQQEVVELAEMLQIPVATSLNAKGTITDNHPLAVGVVGSYSRWCANRVVSEADLVFYIGSHTGSQVTNEWRVPSPGTPVIQLDIDPRELGRTYPAEVAMHGDAKATLRRMIEALEPIGGRADWTDRAQQLVREWREDVAPRANSEAIPIIPERLCNEITQFLPSDSMLVADTGHAGIWTGSMIDFNHPTQEYIRCAGSLGWGLSAAMGAKCALPDRPVLCFSGDGGFWYHIAELETAVRNNINVVTVINNNSALSQDQRGDERAYAGMEGGIPRSCGASPTPTSRRSPSPSAASASASSVPATFRARWNRRLRRAAPPWWTWRPTRWTASPRCRGARKDLAIPRAHRQF